MYFCPKLENMKIELHEGIEDVKFGLNQEQIQGLWGEPDEIEEIEDEEGSITVWHYDEREASLSFDPLFENKLSGIAISSDDVTLQGEKIMGKGESEVLDLLDTFGLDDIEGEELEEGESVFFSLKSGITLFFDNNELLEVKLSPDFNDETETVIWPS